MKFIPAYAVILGALVSFTAGAQNSLNIGDYVVHYNAISSDFLSPNVANSYGVKRSKNRGLLNVSVVRGDGSFHGAEADLKVSATNLTGQLRQLKMRKITEQNAVYYISEFPVRDQETLDFNIKVTTLDKASDNIRFRQQFFTH